MQLTANTTSAPAEIPCSECGRPVAADSEGVCYSCQCALHAAGVIDMDRDDYRGPMGPSASMISANQEAAAEEAEARHYASLTARQRAREYGPKLRSGINRNTAQRRNLRRPSIIGAAF